MMASSVTVVWLLLLLCQPIISSKANKQCNEVNFDNNEISVFCSKTSLTVLKNITPNITELRFHLGNLGNLEGSPFGAFHQLKYLSLESNNIRNIQNTAFLGLKNLIDINLNKNPLVIISKDLFLPCPKLQRVYFIKNKFAQFGTIALATAHLKNLREIIVAKNPNIRLVSRDVLPLANSKFSYLKLAHCYNNNVTLPEEPEPGFLSPLKNLRTLDLTGNLVLLLKNRLQNFLYNLSTVESLHLNYMNMDADFFSRLLLPINLNLLDLSGNRLIRLKSDMFSAELMHLHTLVLDDCRIEIIEKTVLDNLTALTSLSLNRNNILSIMLAVVNLKDLKSLYVKDFQGTKISSIFFINKLRKLKTLETLIFDGNLIKQNRSLILRSLKTLSLKRCFSSMNKPGEMILFHLKQLETLFLSDNQFFNFPSSRFFINQINLKNLYLDGNRLDFSSSSMDFSYLKKLEFLDLGNNGLTFIPQLQLQSIKNLKVLRLSGNRIHTWNNVQVLKIQSLRTLVISNNSLVTVTKEMIRDFSQLRSIDVSVNPFNCSFCETYDFVTWLKKGKIRADKWYKMFCYSKNRPVLQLLKIAQPLHCIPDYTAVFISTPITIALVAIIAFVVYHYRWYIRYYWFLTRAKVQKKRWLSIQDRFRYDAFVSYNENDSDWLFENLIPKLEESGDEMDEPSIKLCIHERDFIAGKEIINNIVEGIDNSRRVILLLSNNFLESNWCTWEMRFAQHKVVDEKREMLILIMLEKIAKEKMSSTLRYLIRTRTYLEWDENPQAQKLFWKRLHYVLKRDDVNVSNENTPLLL